LYRQQRVINCDILWTHFWFSTYFPCGSICVRSPTDWDEDLYPKSPILKISLYSSSTFFLYKYS
jgi:hypothetical protein